MQENNNRGKKKTLAGNIIGKGSIYHRVRNINIAIFLLAFVLMVAVMLSAFNNIVSQVSADNAGRYAASTADAFSTNIIKEIDLISEIESPDCVVAWFTDEENDPVRLLVEYDLADVIEDLFAQFDNDTLRGLVIDEKGMILLDSLASLESETAYLDFKAQIEKEFGSPLFMQIISRHLDNADGVFEERGEPVVIELNDASYRFASIAGIQYTPWSVVLLYNPSSFLSMWLFVPIIAILIVLLMVFALALNAVSNREIFKPLDRLLGSLVRLKEDSEARVYGVDRDDEIGNLSNTIVDLFTKANYDALTGIYNRHYMETTFQSIMHLLSRSDGVLSVLMIDVDFFKRYNDEYGHDKGDICLKAIAQTLAESLTRKEDFVARYGGEEFIVVLPNTDESGARIMANRLLESIRTLEMTHAESAAMEYVTVSIGVTTGKVFYTQSGEEFVKHADDALYKAKQSGRDRYVFIPLEDEDFIEE